MSRKRFIYNPTSTTCIPISEYNFSSTAVALYNYGIGDIVESTFGKYAVNGVSLTQALLDERKRDEESK